MKIPMTPLRRWRALLKLVGKTPYRPVVKASWRADRVGPYAHTYRLPKRDLARMGHPPIHMYVQATARRNPSTDAALLIHEYGHQGAWKTLGRKATEADAWAVGRRLVPPELVPENYNNIARHYLSYVKGAKQRRRSYK